MQILIEIPDAEYDYIKDFKGTNSTITGRLYEAVYNGKPLPKGYAGEVVRILKDFLNWYTLPFNDTLFMHDDEIIAKYLKIMEEKNDKDSN